MRIPPGYVKDKGQKKKVIFVVRMGINWSLPLYMHYHSRKKQTNHGAVKAVFFIALMFCRLI